MVEPRLWRMERLAPSRMGEKMTRDRSIGCLFLVITWVLPTTVLLLRPLYSVPGKEFLISICKLLPIVYLGTYICRYTRMECRSVHQVAMPDMEFSLDYFPSRPSTSWTAMPTASTTADRLPASEPLPSCASQDPVQCCSYYILQARL